MGVDANEPKLRFPEFSLAWNLKKVRDILKRYSEINKDEEFKIDDILSLSSQHGILDRRELLEDTYDKVNHKNYIKTRVNDIVYGKSITTNNPFGLFKANNCRDGLLSTLYYTFKTTNELYPLFFDKYFSLNTRANNYLRKYVLVGDRYITADSNFILSGDIHIPSLEEQTKISLFLTTIEDKLQALKKKKELLEQYKKGMMQKLFSKEIRFKKDDGTNYPDWEEKKLIEIAFKKKGKNKNAEIKNVFTNSANLGIINQRDFFDKDIANQNNISGYYVVDVDDFIYNPRISNSAPVGPISRNKIGLGIMSPLYTVFRFTESLNYDFLEQFFNTNIWHSHMEDIANYGARADRMSFAIGDFFEMPIAIPSLSEQTKIANFLMAIDDKIAHCQSELDGLEQWRNGLLQQMFC